MSEKRPARSGARFGVVPRGPGRVVVRRDRRRRRADGFIGVRLADSPPKPGEEERGETGPDPLEGGVITDSGDIIEADVVLVGVGVRPRTAWLAGSGLAIDRAVLVDAEHRTSDPRVFAVGDAAARMSARYGKTIWAEHWDEARTGPAVVGAVIANGFADSGELDEVPYFWSDQFGKKIQYVGHHDGTDRLVLREGIDGRWGAAWISPDGILRAHLTVSAPRYTATARSAIAAGTIVDPEGIGDLATPLR